ncbi:hypothetical protein DPMN_135190 [Dreissena polymorpha]|uniref:Secreted protein n=1 Tax=Dreissena polymorpha TaxID=45954 RepID=A0A9D4FYJ6_DREPO|nr:hypothetical protein DPMN_135190 [Dreissena polymorpha]
MGMFQAYRRFLLLLHWLVLLQNLPLLPPLVDCETAGDVGGGGGGGGGGGLRDRRVAGALYWQS